MLSRKDFDRPWRWGRDRGGLGHPPSFHLTARPAPGSGEAFESKDPEKRGMSYGNHRYELLRPRQVESLRNQRIWADAGIGPSTAWT